MKITTIDQVLDLAQTLNELYESSNIQHVITISDFEDEAGIRALAKQENERVFEPCEMVNYLFADITLGKIQFTLRGKIIN